MLSGKCTRDERCDNSSKSTVGKMKTLRSRFHAPRKMIVLQHRQKFVLLLVLVIAAVVTIVNFKQSTSKWDPRDVNEDSGDTVRWNDRDRGSESSVVLNASQEFPINGSYPIPLKLDTGSPECFAALYPPEVLYPSEALNTSTALPSAGTPHLDPRANSTTTPYKLFVYELPQKVDLRRCRGRLQRCGFGEDVGLDQGAVLFMDTEPDSLDVILHHKLLLSPYRTHDPTTADAFYVPLYSLCREVVDVREVMEHISALPYYRADAPHVLPAAAVLGARQGVSWPWNVTLLGIPEESAAARPFLVTLPQESSGVSRSFIPVPPPSYFHFIVPGGGKYRGNMFTRFPRCVFVFAAADAHPNDPVHEQILAQFTNITDLKSQREYEIDKYCTTTKIPAMWLQTSWRDEGRKRVDVLTAWLRQSVFCVHLPGSPSKGVYDALLAGCIPVLFASPPPGPPWLPDYDDVSVLVPPNMTHRFREILERYERHEATLLQQLRRKLKSIMPQLQYSFPVDNRPHTDAMQPVLDALGRSLSLGA